MLQAHHELRVNTSMVTSHHQRRPCELTSDQRKQGGTSNLISTPRYATNCISQR